MLGRANFQEGRGKKGRSLALVFGRRERRPICEPCIDMRWKLAMEAFEKPSRRPRSLHVSCTTSRPTQVSFAQHRPSQRSCEGNADTVVMATATAGAGAGVGAGAHLNCVGWEGSWQLAAIVSDRHMPQQSPVSWDA
jgi:hypothetical protein